MNSVASHRRGMEGPRLPAPAFNHQLTQAWPALHGDHCFSNSEYVDTSAPLASPTVGALYKVVPQRWLLFAQSTVTTGSPSFPLGHSHRNKIILYVEASLADYYL